MSHMLHFRRGTWKYNCCGELVKNKINGVPKFKGGSKNILSMGDLKFKGGAVAPKDTMTNNNTPTFDHFGHDCV